MERREASINDVPIRSEDRKFDWDTPDNIRPEDFPSLSQLENELLK